MCEAPTALDDNRAWPAGWLSHIAVLAGWLGVWLAQIVAVMPSIRRGQWRISTNRMYPEFRMTLPPRRVGAPMR